MRGDRKGGGFQGSFSGCRASVWDDKHALGMLLFVMAVQQCDMLAAPRLSTSHALVLLL